MRHGERMPAPRNPSHLTSNSHSGWENGSRIRLSGIGWRCGRGISDSITFAQAVWDTGRKIENVVPELPCFTELLNRIVPPYFFTMPSDTDNPMPVPLLPFVV